MNVYGYHSTNIRPVSCVYNLDEDVSLKHTVEHTQEGLDVSFTDALSSFEDVSVNNFNQLFLTDIRGTCIRISSCPERIYFG